MTTATETEERHLLSQHLYVHGGGTGIIWHFFHHGVAIGCSGIQEGTIE